MGGITALGWTMLFLAVLHFESNKSKIETNGNCK